MDFITVIKNILIETERLERILEEINSAYGNDITQNYKKIIYSLFLKVAYISGIADKKFVYEEKVVILYYFELIYENSNNKNIAEVKQLINQSDVSNERSSKENSNDELKRIIKNSKDEANQFYKDKLISFENDKDVSIDKLPELNEVIALDQANDTLFYYKIVSCLYRFASYIIKADGVIDDRELKTLRKLWMKLYSPESTDAKQQFKISKQTISKSLNELTNVVSNDKNNNLEKNIKELNKLIGLKKVKEEIISLVNYLKIAKLRSSKRLKNSDITMHSVFTGNPGTGKTMVARILANIYKSLGLLKKGHLVETDRAGMVADFIGQTATKTDKIIDEALDGVLFIDEAYALNPPKNIKGDFGPEAISTLLKRMEDNRDKLIVIVAGYPEEMKVFLESNPGFKSRFNKYIHFPDYTPKELFDIFEYFCNEMDYVLSENAKNKVYTILEEHYKNKDKYFGNARLARNMFENALRKHSNRVAEIAPITKKLLMLLEAVDIDAVSTIDTMDN